MTAEQKARCRRSRIQLYARIRRLGLKAIFLGDHAEMIEGMDYSEGRALIEELNQMITPEARVYTSLGTTPVHRMG